MSDRLAELHLHLDGTWEQTCKCRRTFTAATATQVAARFDEHDCTHLTVAALLTPDCPSLPAEAAS
jgi:hypothetical protein